MNVKLVQRIEVNLLASFLSEIVLQIFIVISVHVFTQQHKFSTI